MSTMDLIVSKIFMHVAEPGGKIIHFSFAVTGVNLLLEFNHSYLDMIMSNYIKLFCSS